MNASGIKKLITGFLILSALSGSLTLIFLNFAEQGASSASSGATESGAQNPLPVGKNAFVEQLPNETNALQETGATFPGLPATDQTAHGSNLTKNFARVFAREIIANNPEGPQLDPNGQPTTLNLPSDSYATELIRQTLSSSTVGVNEKIPAADVNIKNNYAPEDVARYFETVHAILQDVASSTNSLDLADQSSTPETLSLSRLIFESAYRKLADVSAPQPVAEMHRSILEFFANQNKIFEIISNYQTDPLQAVFALQADGQIVERDLERLQNEVKKFKSGPLSFLYPEPNNASFLSGLLGIKIARAQTAFNGIAAVPTGTIFDPANLPHWLLDLADWVKKFVNDLDAWVYKTALRIAVNVLIDEFQNEVVNWIAGNGNPQFITDWKGFLANVADVALGNAIYQLAPGLCSGFGPLIQVMLYLPYAVIPVQCTLSQIIQNVSLFYSNFQNGGWISYGVVIAPENNFFGSLIISNDYVTRKVISAVGGANAEALANNGFKPFTKCVKRYTDYGPFGEPPGSCEQEVATTPGGAAAHALFSSFDWKPNEIINAQRFEDLVGAIVDAVVFRITKEGLSALSGPSNPAPQASVPTLAQQLGNTTLNGYLNGNSQAQQGIAPAGVPNPGDLSSVKSSLSALLNQQSGTLQKFQDTANSDSQWLALEPQVITALNQVASSCAGLATNSQQKIAELAALAPDVAQELQNVSSETAVALKAQIASATSTDALNAILNQLQGLDANTASSAASTAQDRLTRLQNLQANAQANLPNVCNVPLIDTSVATSSPPVGP